MVAYALSSLTLKGNKQTAHKSTYQKEAVSEINDIKEQSEINFPIIKN